MSVVGRIISNWFGAQNNDYQVKVTTSSDGDIQHVIVDSGLVPDTYDYISLSYTGDNLTGVVYKTGGSGGTTVATLTLTYSGSDLTSVSRT